MWKKLKTFVWNEQSIENRWDDEITPENQLKNLAAILSVEEITLDTAMLIKQALAHYCEICKRGFKTKGARNAHNSLKHKHE